MDRQSSQGLKSVLCSYSFFSQTTNANCVTKCGAFQRIRFGSTVKPLSLRTVSHRVGWLATIKICPPL